MKLIIQNEKECFIYRVNYDVKTIVVLHEHHILKGTVGRKLSEKSDLKVFYTIDIM